MDVTLNQLRAFAEVARRGSFTRAAEALSISQPAVSKSVKDLERQVGMPLFELVGRRVVLTGAGRVLEDHAARILAELAGAEEALRGLREGDAGRLVVGASTTPGTYLLPAVLGTFARAYPRVEVALEIGDTAQILARVSAGELELGVVGEAQFPPATLVEPFCRERLVLILPAAHPLARRASLRLRDLATEPFVLRERGSSTREVLEAALRTQEFEPRVVMELGSTEAVKKTVSAGLGISFVSQHSVQLEVHAGALASRSVVDLQLERGLYVVRRAGGRLSGLHQLLLEALRNAA